MLLPEKNFINESGISQGHVQKSVQVSAIVVSSTPSASSAIKPPKYTLVGCGDPEPVDEGDVQMEYSYD